MVRTFTLSNYTQLCFKMLTLQSREMNSITSWRLLITLIWQLIKTIKTISPSFNSVSWWKKTNPFLGGGRRDKSEYEWFHETYFLSPVLNIIWLPSNHWLINFNPGTSFLFIGRVARIKHIYTELVLIVIIKWLQQISEAVHLRINCVSLYIFFVFFLTLVAFNFIVNDSRKRPIWNVMMWTSLFAGNGVLLCFYSQEWYARQHCPLKNVSHQSGWSGKATCLSTVRAGGQC